MSLLTSMQPGTIGRRPGIRVTGTELPDRTAESVVDGWVAREVDSVSFFTAAVCPPRSFRSSSSTVSIGTDSPLGRGGTAAADDSELACSSSASISSSVLASPYNAQQTSSPTHKLSYDLS